MRMDWAALMRLGIRDLGLAPDAFWDLTPAELALRLGVDPGRSAMDRSSLAALVARFPDKRGDCDE